MSDIHLGKNKEKKGFNYSIESLKKHFIALGGSGSGKTVLSKIIVEEAALKGIPSILVDTQGDLSSLGILAEENDIKKHSIDKNKINNYKKTKVVIYTPTSKKGIPICLNPLKKPPKNIDTEELTGIVNQISSSICQLIGYKLNNDKGRAAQAVLYITLDYVWKRNIELKTFNQLTQLTTNIPDPIKNKIYEFISNENELKELSKKIKFLTIGNKELLFQFGVPLDISQMLKKSQINIIFLNSLNSQNEKTFFLSMLSTALYQWMLQNPSNKLQALFMIDEIAEYIPAGSKKPITKDILRLIFKQARKYGIGCLICTQNPGDIDYKAFAQFGTWAIGRLTTKQDRLKIRDTLKSLSSQDIEKTLLKLPKLKSGEFMFFCPDLFSDIEQLNSRWLYSRHKTLTLHEISNMITEEIRQQFQEITTSDISTKTPVKISQNRCENEHSNFKVNITNEKLNTIIKNQKKKLFVLFGPHKEFVESIKLYFRPIIVSNVKVIKKGLLRKKINEITVCFDGITGNILKFDGDNFSEYEGNSYLLGMEDDEIRIIKALSKGKKPMTNTEIAIEIKSTEGLIKKSTNNLLKNRKISATEKIGKLYLFEPIIYVKNPIKIEKIVSRINNPIKQDIYAQIMKKRVNIEELNKIMNSWYNGATIVDCSVIYYPYYSVKFKSKRKSRTIDISGVNGRILDS